MPAAVELSQLTALQEVIYELLSASSMLSSTGAWRGRPAQGAVLCITGKTLTETLQVLLCGSTALHAGSVSKPFELWAYCSSCHERLVIHQSQKMV